MLVLASRSPRRAQLLSMITNEFKIIPSEFDEKTIAESSPILLVERLANEKAKAVYKDIDKNDIVIGSDTVVIVNNQILGIPKNQQDAYNMISMLSGKTHTVATGVAIISQNVDKSFVSQTQVKFFDLTEQEIKEYISTSEPYDKAGGYGIQGKAALFIEEIQGDYYSVMGLPIARLKKELSALI
ncbi:MAG: Maf family protein [Oscillospiraceae bacterium]